MVDAEKQKKRKGFKMAVGAALIAASLGAGPAKKEAPEQPKPVQNTQQVKQDKAQTPKPTRAKPAVPTPAPTSHVQEFAKNLPNNNKAQKTPQDDNSNRARSPDAGKPAQRAPPVDPDRPNGNRTDQSRNDNIRVGDDWKGERHDPGGIRRWIDLPSIGAFQGWVQVPAFFVDTGAVADWNANLNNVSQLSTFQAVDSLRVDPKLGSAVLGDVSNMQNIAKQVGGAVTLTGESGTLDAILWQNGVRTAEITYNVQSYESIQVNSSHMVNQDGSPVMAQDQYTLGVVNGAAVYMPD